MSTFATYFDQAMSSTEEEQEELQDHKTRKRKLILLPRVQGYLDNPRLSFAVGEDGQNSESLNVLHKGLLDDFHCSSSKVPEMAGQR